MTRASKRGIVFLAGLFAVIVAAPAFGHAERSTRFPEPPGRVPKYRTGGTAHVVCKGDTARRIANYTGGLRSRNEALLARCRYSNIQEAVNAAKSGDRILIMPGVYKELPSRRFPDDDPACSDLFDPNGSPSYAYHLKCPHAQNLITIMGDADDDFDCDAKCRLQIEGTGRRPGDVLVDGDYSKLNVIRADRTDEIYFRNFHVKNGDFNALYILETDGFVIDRMIGSHSVEYAFLTFASDHGLYKDCEAFYTGDGGLYPGSAAGFGHSRHSTEIRNCDSHHNLLGYSGTAGNSVWVHDNRFHHNSVGMVTDSLFPDHPGLPQNSARWEDNLIYSNNMDVFDDRHDEICTRPIKKRPENIVCPAIGVPTGTGVLIAGGNDNIVTRNFIYDNWRYGAMQFHVPGPVRSEYDPTKVVDTSHFNHYMLNLMGVSPRGDLLPNGLDFWWDEQGSGNCWERNFGGKDGISSDPIAVLMPLCDDTPLYRPGNYVKLGSIAPCALWGPDNRDPVGCTWMTPPEKP